MHRYFAMACSFSSLGLGTASAWHRRMWERAAGTFARGLKFIDLLVGVGGKVQYPLMALESGLAPLADLSNTTALLNNCIVPSSGPTASKRFYNGRLVSRSAAHQKCHAFAGHICQQHNWQAHNVRMIYLCLDAHQVQDRAWSKMPRKRAAAQPEI